MSIPAPPPSVNANTERRAHTRPLRELADDELAALREIGLVPFDERIRIPLRVLAKPAKHEEVRREGEGRRIVSEKTA